MQRENKILAIVSSAAIFILMEIAALNMISHNGDIQRSWFASMGHDFMAKVWGVGDSIRDYFSLRSQNDKLALEVFELGRELDRYKAAEEARREEEHTASLAEYGDFIYTPAKIVKMSRNKQHNYFIIDKGAEEGIRPQSGIITGKGAVGIVDAVDRHYSYCLSFMNDEISVSARIGREGIVGPLLWDGKSSKGAILKEIPLQYKYSQGDTVWTSGFSALFPPDIPLGLAGKAKVINGSVNEISVTLFEDFSSLRYISVAENGGRDEITELEQMEERP